MSLGRVQTNSSCSHKQYRRSIGRSDTPVQYGVYYTYYAHKQEYIEPVHVQYDKRDPWACIYLYNIILYSRSSRPVSSNSGSRLDRCWPTSMLGTLRSRTTEPPRNPGNRRGGNRRHLRGKRPRGEPNNFRKPRAR